MKRNVVPMKPDLQPQSESAAIAVQPGALLVSASPDLAVEQLNETLRPYRLCLPIAPLAEGLSLAELIAHNAGGRRRLRYGTIVRYLRAATLEPEENAAQPPLLLGGPTLKRATGYGLNRALVGGWLQAGRLQQVTLSLCPLPPARQAMQVRCADLPAACRLAAQLVASGLALSALALKATLPDSAAAQAELLIELEGHTAVVEQQSQQLTTMLQQADALILESAIGWSAWEELARERRSHNSLALDLSLPRAALPDFIGQAQTIAQRYRMPLSIWGDAGVGTLHLSLLAQHFGEAQPGVALLYTLAQQMGGALCTELGGSPLATQFWEHELQQRGIARLWQQPTLRPTATPAHSANRPLHPSPSSAAHAALLERLRSVVGSQYVLSHPTDIECYTQDASIAQAAGQALVVVLPASTAEVSAVLRLATTAGLPVVTRGAGSGLAGGSIPTPGALLLALTRMQQIRIDPTQMIARVEAGAVTAELQQAAEVHGLIYPPDPSSLGVSTLGGNIACNAGGPRCVKYGVTADYVLGLTAVLADGAIVRLGDGLTGQTPDAGLLQLLIGSEGTLAVITEATLRLIPRPAARRTALAIFDRLDDACATVETIMAAGVLPASLELMDDTTIAVVDDYLRLGLPRDAGALLLLLADGPPAAVDLEVAVLADLARRGGARTVQVAQHAADEAALWKARRAIAPALARVRPNRLGEDICVPLNQIARCVRRIKTIAATYDQPIAVFGHAGDGNLHPNILFDSRDAQQVTRVWQAAEAVFLAALELGGTLSGEHGIGTLKRPFMRAALGDAVLALQHALKRHFDPEGRLNPGKVLPDATDPAENVLEH